GFVFCSFFFSDNGTRPTRAPASRRGNASEPGRQRGRANQPSWIICASNQLLVPRRPLGRGGRAPLRRTRPVDLGRRDPQAIRFRRGPPPPRAILARVSERAGGPGRPRSPLDAVDPPERTDQMTQTYPATEYDLWQWLWGLFA